MVPGNLYTVLCCVGVAVPDEMTVAHSGEIGDLILALPTIKAIGANKIYAVDRPWTRPDFKGRSRFLKRLVESQPYIESLEPHAGQPIDIDLSCYRSHGHKFGETIINRIARFARAKVDQSQQWLEVEPDKRTKGRIVINRCPRWQGINFPWREIVQSFKKDILFIGLDSEWKKFCAEFGMVEYLRTNDLYEAAMAIRGSDTFLGNQSSCNAICEGLNHPSVLETCVTSFDCCTNRPNCTYSVTGKVSFSALGKDFRYEPAKRGTCYVGMVDGEPVWHPELFFCELMCRAAYLAKELPVPPSTEVRAGIVQA